MNFKELAKKFRAFFEEEEEKSEKNQKVVFAEATETETGVVVVANAFEVGQEVFLKTDEGDFVQAPEGVYVLDNGLTITVVINEEGESVISEVVDGGESNEGESDETIGFVSKEEFEAQMSAMTELMSKTLDKMSKIAVAMKDWKKDESKEDKKEYKMASEAKKEAFLLGLAEKKKRIKESREKTVKMENTSRRGFVSGIKTRLQENLEAEGLR